MRECRPTGPSAWDIILAERDSMMRVALARAGNRDDAEDLVQEAMTRAAGLPDLRHETAGPLLRTIVINLAIDQHRRAATQNRYEARMSADARTVAPVDEAVCDRSEASWLREVIQQSAGRDQQVLLHRAAGHSVRSSAERLGLTYKAAESAYTRARHRARLAWQATLAALLGSGAALRRAHRTSPAAAVVVATGLVLAVSYASPDQPRRSPAASDEPGTTAHSVQRARQASAQTRAVDQVRGERRRPVTTRRTLDTGEVGSPGLLSTGVAVEDAHEEETFLQTVERCLSRGLIVTPTHVDCR